MCQQVNGPRVVLNERWAWKAFGGEDLRPLLRTKQGKWAWPTSRPYRRGVWHKSTEVKTKALGSYTAGGFHVFRRKSDAVRYSRIMQSEGYVPGHVAKVRIRGNAVPFDDMSGPGWAVHEMFIPEEG